MKLNFIKNFQLDVENWQKALILQSYHTNWKDYIPVDLPIECVKNNKCLTDYLKRNYYDSGKIDLYIENLKNNINAFEIQKDLETLEKRVFPAGITINVFITTFVRAPYNTKDNFFYLRYRTGEEYFKKSITSIYHELMHFLFHWNYWQQCQLFGLKENQIHDIKESFTVLLNPILEKRNLPLDVGYKTHFNLREKIMEFWKQKNDFEFVLNETIKIIKNKLLTK